MSGQDLQFSLPDGVYACDMAVFTIWCDLANTHFTAINIPQDIFVSCYYPVVSTVLSSEFCQRTVLATSFCMFSVAIIRESLDSLCRDGTDMPRPLYIGKACTRPNLQDLRLFR